IVKAKVGINVFGHIGLLVTRAAFNSGKVDIVTLSDPFVDLYMVYMFLYDSTHGKFHSTVKTKNGKLVINGHPITIFQECKTTGVFTTREKSGDHLQGDAKRITSPPSADTPTFMLGVNHKKYKNSLTIVSNGSYTTSCLALLARVIHDNFGIIEGLTTTVHAVIATQKTVDGFPKDWEDVSLVAINIIPASTGTAKAVGKIIPELNGKLPGMAFHVPTTNLSVMNLTCLLEKAAKYDDIKKVVKEASEGLLKGILGSDAGAGIALNNPFFQIHCHYDNEFGYSNRVVDLMASKE
uniref:glyceraldehyde-3-phosphate dehydrogenase (phosphorylating) n=1 Tax=Otolemur garnettii TaxID=30611 RepID=H0XUI9_OTOGA